MYKEDDAEEMCRIETLSCHREYNWERNYTCQANKRIGWKRMNRTINREQNRKKSHKYMSRGISLV